MNKVIVMAIELLRDNINLDTTNPSLSYYVVNKDDKKMPEVEKKTINNLFFAVVSCLKTSTNQYTYFVLLHNLLDLYYMLYICTYTYC